MLRAEIPNSQVNRKKATIGDGSRPPTGKQSQKRQLRPCAVQQLAFVRKAAAQSQPDHVHSCKAEATTDSYETRFRRQTIDSLRPQAGSKKQLWYALATG